MKLDPKTIQSVVEAIEAQEKIPFDATRKPPEEADKTLLSLETTAEELPEVELGELIGEGGMGQIFSAKQRSLSREVAVKKLKPNRRHPNAINALLREAKRTGSLEHPNIVPVHLLSYSADGLPILVMKRVVGAPWREMIHNPNHELWKNFTGDRLTIHLEFLKQVCNAVHFAHSQRILHRDIKPANVMIGQFGEVYLLDWGIALSFDDIKSKEEGGSTALAGTLSYMAPEMLLGATSLSARTDVYLLGATLHEILTQNPPHTGETVADVIHSTVAPAFEYPPIIPSGIAEICQKAMNPNVEKRFESALVLRQAISNFLQNRSVLELYEASHAKLDRLKQLLANAKPNQQEVHNLFSECRFGFEQVLKLKPKETQATQRREEALLAMLGYELSQRNVSAAESLLAALTSPPADLVAELTRIKQEQRQREEALKKLENMEYQRDTKVSGWQRNLVVLATFLCYTGVAGLLAIREKNTPETAETLLWAQVFFAVASLAVAIPTRRIFFRNEANRRIYYAAIFLVGIITLAHLVGYLLAVPSKHIFIIDILLWDFFSGAISIFVDKILLWSVIAHTIAAVVASFYPPFASFLMGGALIVTGYCMIALWQRNQSKQQGSPHA
jgi:serine/threonine protein kinase